MTPSAVASRRLGRSRTISSLELVEQQKARVERLSERIGQLMSQRVDEEEILAAMYEQLGSKDRAEAAPPSEPHNFDEERG